MTPDVKLTILVNMLSALINAIIAWMSYQNRKELLFKEKAKLMHSFAEVYLGLLIRWQSEDPRIHKSLENLNKEFSENSEYAYVLGFSFERNLVLKTLSRLQHIQLNLESSRDRRLSDKMSHQEYEKVVGGLIVQANKKLDKFEKIVGGIKSNSFLTKLYRIYNKTKYLAREVLFSLRDLLGTPTYRKSIPFSPLPSRLFIASTYRDYWKKTFF